MTMSNIKCHITHNILILYTGLNHKLYLVIPFPDNEMHNGTFKTLGPRIQRGYRMVDSNITIKSFY